ncbi:MAG: hypothetical protein GY751_16215 [Bacteroidetes bacterium]|nr:hypothetical protein [Bacteroidota bacterium]
MKALKIASLILVLFILFSYFRASDNVVKKSHWKIISQCQIYAYMKFEDDLDLNNRVIYEDSENALKMGKVLFLFFEKYLVTRNSEDKCIAIYVRK